MRLKRWAFYCLLPITIPLIVVLATIDCVCDILVDKLYQFENWAFRK